MNYEDYIFYGILLFMWLEYLWELHLLIRQQIVYRKTLDVPPELKDAIKRDMFEKARVYGLDCIKFFIVKDFYGIVASTLFLTLDALVYFWNVSESNLARLNLENGELLQTAMFVFIINTYDTLLSLPFIVYDVFVLEEKHGFNKQTAGFFIKDKIKEYVLTQLFLIPLLTAVVYIVKVGGDYFFIYIWLFAMTATFFILTIYADFVAPLFDKFTPLPEGELKNRIEQLAASLHFPLSNIYIVEGSMRSVHSNAYFYGLFKNKRIVLYDTLLKDYYKGDKDGEEKKGCDNEEVIAVLAHEFGHWKLNHIIKLVIIMQINLILIFLAFGFLFKYEVIYRAFGFYSEQPILIGLIIVLQLILKPYNTVLNIFLIIVSRRFEFQADAFAKSLGKAVYLKRGLIKVHSDNLAFPVDDWLFSAFHLNHPSLLERIKALDKSD